MKNDIIKKYNNGVFSIRESKIRKKENHEKLFDLDKPVFMDTTIPIEKLGISPLGGTPIGEVSKVKYMSKDGIHGFFWTTYLMKEDGPVTVKHWAPMSCFRSNKS